MTEIFINNNQKEVYLEAEVTETFCPRCGRQNGDFAETKDGNFFNSNNGDGWFSIGQATIEQATDVCPDCLSHE